MATKTQVNAVFKEYGLSFAKMSKNSMESVCIKEHDKRIKGIYTSSYGPMTVTNVYREKFNEILRGIKADLSYIGVVEDSKGRLVVSRNSKTATYVALNEQHYRTYTRCRNLDDGYKSIYIVPYFYTGPNEQS